MKFLLIYVPNLRFNEFSLPWHQMRIIDLLSFQNGINGTPEQYGKGIKYISVGDILNNDYITYDKIAGSIDINQETLKNYSVTYGDILFQRSSEIKEDIGRTNVYLDKDHTATFGGFVIRGKKIGDYNPTFFNYLLKSPSSRQSIVRLGAGAQHYNIGQENIKTLNFYFPDEEEQQKIASLFSKIDERIQTQIKIIDDLLTVKNGISNKLFKLQQIELSNHYLFEYLTEGDKTAVDTSCYKKITVKLNNQGLAFSELNREMADTRPFYVRHKGELIIGKQNYFNGSIAIVTEQFDNCICSNAIMSFKIKDIDSDFLYYQISNNNYLNSQSYKANGTGQKELSEKEFLNFKIWCPQLEVQQKIVNCFKSLDLKIENEKAILNSYFQEKSYLLNNMFI